MRYRVISWGSIHSHTNICLRKSTMIDPWEGSRSDGCMEFKIIPCYKSNSKRIILKSHNFKTYSLCQRNNAEAINHQIKRGCLKNKYQKGSSSFVSLKLIYHSHKRTLWMEEPIPNSQSGRSNQGRLKIQMSSKKKASK